MKGARNAWDRLRNLPLQSGLILTFTLCAGGLPPFASTAVAQDEDSAALEKDSDPKSPKTRRPFAAMGRRSGIGLFGGGSVPLAGEAQSQAIFSAVGHYRITPQIGIGGFGLISSRDSSASIREFFYLGGEFAIYFPYVYPTLRLGFRGGWIEENIFFEGNADKVNPGFVGLTLGYDYLFIEEASIGIETSMYYLTFTKSGNYSQPGFLTWHTLIGLKYWF